MINDLVLPELNSATGTHLKPELWHPEQVAEDPHLSLEEKRTLLAAFASDDRTVIGKPTLRQLPNGGIVTLASILSLLYKLDGDKSATEILRWQSPSYRRDHILLEARRKSVARRTWKHDDDGPRGPAANSVDGNARRKSPACLSNRFEFLSPGSGWGPEKSQAARALPL